MSGRRHAQRRSVVRDSLQGITVADIRRLARRGGVKRMTGSIVTEARGALRAFLHNMLQDAVVYTTHAHRNTVSTLDVVLALKRQGTHLYGFDTPGDGNSDHARTVATRLRGAGRRGSLVRSNHATTAQPAPSYFAMMVAPSNCNQLLNIPPLPVEVTHARRARVHEALGARTLTPHFTPMTQAQLDAMVNAYNTHFFEGRLLPFFRACGMQLRVRAWVPGTHRIIPEEFAALEWGQALPAPLATGETRVANITFDWARITTLIANVAAASPSTANTMQLASGQYNLARTPKRLVADFFEHELIHALVDADCPGRKADEGAGAPPDPTGHGIVFRTLYTNFFHPHPDFLTGYPKYLTHVYVEAG